MPELYSSACVTVKKGSEEEDHWFTFKDDKELADYGKLYRESKNKGTLVSCVEYDEVNRITFSEYY